MALFLNRHRQRTWQDHRRWALDLSNLKQSFAAFFNFRDGRASHAVLLRRIRNDARIDGIHVCQLIAAMIIASIGLNIDSTEAVIGAMLICPIMGSVMAIAYSIATVDSGLFRKAISGLGVQFIVCLVTSTVYFVVSPLATETSELLSNSSPTIWDVLIALVGGFAGALGTSRSQEPSTLIAGVAVATALMPPLCAIGFGLAARNLVLAFSALYEFLVNVVFIAFGASLVFTLLRVPLQCDLDGDGKVTVEETELAKKHSEMLRKRLVIGLVIFAIPCLFFSAQMVRQSVEENGTLFESFDTYDTELTTLELRTVCPQLVSYRIGTEDSYNTETRTLEQHIVATVVTSSELTGSQRTRIERLIRLHVDDIDQVTFEVAEPAEPELGGG